MSAQELERRRRRLIEKILILQTELEKLDREIQARTRLPKPRAKIKWEQR